MSCFAEKHAVVFHQHMHLFIGNGYVRLIFEEEEERKHVFHLWENSIHDRTRHHNEESGKVLTNLQTLQNLFGKSYQHAPTFQSIFFKIDTQLPASIHTFNNEMYFFQEKAYGYLPVQEKSVTTTSDGKQMVS